MIFFSNLHFFFLNIFERKWKSTIREPISKCSIITYNQLNTCLSRERHFFPLPITLFLFQKLERRKCSVRDTSIERIRMVNNRIIVQRSTRSFSLSFFFQTNFKNAKRKRKSMESIERSHYCSTIDAYFSPFFFFFF